MIWPKNKYYILPYIIFLFCSITVLSQQEPVDSFSIKARQLKAADLLQLTDSFKMKVVAASRSSKNIDDLPVTIYVVTREEILNNHYVTLADVLKSLPGIRVSQPSSGELGEVFLLRGFIGNYYTKILLNGIPIKPSGVSGMPIDAQLPIRQAERIEVVFGPSGSVYGADAASGVINIITRETEKGTFAQADITFGQNDYTSMNYTIGGKAGKNRNLIQYSFYGSKTDFNNINVKNDVNGSYNPLNYYQSKKKPFNINGTNYSPLNITNNLLLQNGIQPQSFINNYYPLHYAGSLTEPDMNAELSSGSQNVGINLKFRGLGFSYDNMYRHTSSSLGKSPYFYRYNDPLAYIGDRIHRFALSYNTPIGRKLTSTTNLCDVMYRMDNNSSVALTFLPNAEKAYVYSASDDILLEQLVTYTPVTNIEILSGASYQASSNMPKTNYMISPFPRNTYKPFASINFPDDSVMGRFGYHSFTFHNVSAFTQAYWVVKNFRLMGGFRYDANSFYGNSLNPRLAVMYRLPKTILRASAGTAIRATPSSLAYESLAYRTGSKPDSIHYLVVPNSNLKPENYTAYEFSADRRWFNRVDIGVSFYYNSIHNYVNNNTIIGGRNLPFSTSDSVSTKTNDLKAKSILYGVQGTIRYNNLIPKIKLNVQLCVTYNADKSKNLPTVQEIVDLIHLQPKHYGQLRISASPAKNLYIQMDNIWMTKWLRLFIPYENISSELFNKVDGYYTIDFLVNYRFGTNIQAFVKVYNLLNEKYSTLGSYTTYMDLQSIPQPGRNIRFGLTYTLN
jgi:outer membrane receptor for ferrienterochelin and colicin